jgi:hypothetical protein
LGVLLQLCWLELFYWEAMRSSHRSSPTAPRFWPKPLKQRVKARLRPAQSSRQWPSLNRRHARPDALSRVVPRIRQKTVAASLVRRTVPSRVASLVHQIAPSHAAPSKLRQAGVVRWRPKPQPNSAELAHAGEAWIRNKDCDRMTADTGISAGQFRTIHLFAGRAGQFTVAGLSDAPVTPKGIPSRIGISSGLLALLSTQ